MKKIENYADAIGNVLNGTIGKQMVDTLVESTSNVEVHILTFILFASFILCIISHSLFSILSLASTIFCTISLLYSFHPHTFTFPPLGLLHTRLHRTPSSLISVSTLSKMKCKNLQLILNYFKLFLLLPSEEVRNVRPHISTCVNPKHHIYIPKTHISPKHVLIWKLQ